MTVLVYPVDFNRIAAPWSIGNALALALPQPVEVYSWDDTSPRDTYAVEPGDLLVGHPHYSGQGAFNRFAAMHGWDRVVGLSPWNGSDEYRENIEAALPFCDAYRAICGPYWAERMPASWGPLGVRPLDMAIERDFFPPLAREWSPPGQRHAIYIGCTLPSKGIAELEWIIRQVPELAYGHIGPGRVDGCEEHGYWPRLDTPEARAILARYDFVIAPGVNDANPTTVLEAMCWGLIPIAAPTAGWGSDVVLPLNLASLRRLSTTSAEYLDAQKALGFRRVLNYTWARFTGQVLSLEACP